MDIYLPQQRIAILCLKGEKFTINDVVTGPPQHASPLPLGHTKMQQNLMAACKLRVVLIPVHVWLGLNAKGDHFKTQFLQQQIAKVDVPAPGPGPSA